MVKEISIGRTFPARRDVRTPSSSAQSARTTYKTVGGDGVRAGLQRAAAPLTSSTSPIQGVYPHRRDQIDDDESDPTPRSADEPNRKSPPAISVSIGFGGDATSLGVRASVHTEQVMGSEGSPLGEIGSML